MIGVVRRGRGGPNNAKVRPTMDESLELSRQYEALKDKFKEVFRVHKSVASMRTWREIVMKEYEWLPEDIIELLGDPDRVLYSASNLAIELAARKSINHYEPFSVSADRLKKLRRR